MLPEEGEAVRDHRHQTPNHDPPDRTQDWGNTHCTLYASPKTLNAGPENATPDAEATPPASHRIGVLHAVRGKTSAVGPRS